MINILVVDDHDVIIYGITNFFNKSDKINVVDSTVSGEVALEKLKTEDIDVVVLDIGMPNMDGIECCRKMKKLNPAIKVVAFTGETDTQKYYDIWNENVDAIISKTQGMHTLASAIENVYEGSIILGSDIQSFFERSKPIESAPHLTNREKEVLKHLGTGITRREAAEKMFISQDTLNTHCKNIFKKFGENSISDIIAKAKEARMIK